MGRAKAILSFIIQGDTMARGWRFPNLPLGSSRLSELEMVLVTCSRGGWGSRSQWTVLRNSDCAYGNKYRGELDAPNQRKLLSLNADDLCNATMGYVNMGRCQDALFYLYDLGGGGYTSPGACARIGCSYDYAMHFCDKASSRPLARRCTLPEF